jgi:hypothetical protein
MLSILIRNGKRAYHYTLIYQSIKMREIRIVKLRHTQESRQTVNPGMYVQRCHISTYATRINYISTRELTSWVGENTQNTIGQIWLHWTMHENVVCVFGVILSS